MERLSAEVNEVDSEIKQQRAKLQEAMTMTMPLKSLSAKLFGLFFDFIRKKIMKISDGPCYIAKSKQPKEKKVKTSFLEEVKS